jgi:hypothetical protein
MEEDAPLNPDIKGLAAVGVAHAVGIVSACLSDDSELQAKARVYAQVWAMDGIVSGGSMATVNRLLSVKVALVTMTRLLNNESVGEITPEEVEDAEIAALALDSTEALRRQCEATGEAPSAALQDLALRVAQHGPELGR